MTKYIFTIIMISAAVFSSCGSGGGTDPKPNENIATSSAYFPDEQGDKWYYTNNNLKVRRTIGADTILFQTSPNPESCVTVIDSVFFNGSLTDADTKEIWSKDSDGFYVHIIDGILFPQPKLSVPFDIGRDESHNFNALIYFIDGDSLIEASERLIGKFTNLGGVTKTIPAGTFAHTIILRYNTTSPDIDQYDEFYAPNVGLIDNGDYILDSAFVGGIWYRP